MNDIKQFQPTRPLRGATNMGRRKLPARLNFNPRAPCGARLASLGAMFHCDTNFNPRAPCGARRCELSLLLCQFVFQPTRPLRGATVSPSKIRNLYNISTHAPLAGRDRTASSMKRPRRHFNPRAPCGARPMKSLMTPLPLVFQPTRPLRGATRHVRAENRSPIDFNPRAPCGARPMAMRLPFILVVISTHAPLAGRDLLRFSGLTMKTLNFNPRAPCGARLPEEDYASPTIIFQPTRPLRGATAKVYKSLCTFLR